MMTASRLSSILPVARCASPPRIYRTPPRQYPFFARANRQKPLSARRFRRKTLRILQRAAQAALLAAHRNRYLSLYHLNAAFQAFFNRNQQKVQTKACYNASID
jgi:hypothetical protein